MLVSDVGIRTSMVLRLCVFQRWLHVCVERCLSLVRRDVSLMSVVLERVVSVAILSSEIGSV